MFLINGSVQVIMAVLSHDEIINLLDSKELKISPLDRKQIGPGSVDLRLGYVFRVLI